MKEGGGAGRVGIESKEISEQREMDWGGGEKKKENSTWCEAMSSCEIVYAMQPVQSKFERFVVIGFGNLYYVREQATRSGIFIIY